MVMNSEQNNIEVSVIVASYYPSWGKMQFTLDSILMQTGVNPQIIISDDGSDDNLFEEIKAYMQEQDFDNYKLVGDGVNHGTVINIYNGIREADCKYSKFISPGDALHGADALEKWLEALQKSGKKWSFCDAIYFGDIDKDGVKPVAANANPQIVDCYQRCDDDTCRWNYLVLNDLALGACTIGETELLKSCLSEIAGKVKYAEDNIYRILMYRNTIPLYYAKNAVLYEYGTGVSTSANDKWTKLLLEDANEADKVMFSGNDRDAFQNKIYGAYEKRKAESKIGQLNLGAKGRIRIMLKRNLFPRKTPSEL